MATITVNIPDAVMPRVLDAIAARYGHEATVPDPANPAGPRVANPLSKAQFAKARLVDFIRLSVATAEVDAARVAATVKAASEITMN